MTLDQNKKKIIGNLRKLRDKINKTIKTSTKIRFLAGRAFLFIVMNTLLILVVDIINLPYYWILIPYNMVGLWLNWTVSKWTFIPKKKKT